MDKRTVRRQASIALAAAARRLHAETKEQGLGRADQERFEDAYESLAEEMERRGGGPVATDPDPDQFPLFDTPGKGTDRDPEDDDPQ